MATGLHHRNPMEERRKSPRQVTPRVSATVPATVNVQLLDVSVAGALLRASEPVDVGAAASLTVNLHGVPFKADLRVERVALPEQGEGYDLGARFAPLTPEHRDAIRRFVAP